MIDPFEFFQQSKHHFDDFSSLAVNIPREELREGLGALAGNSSNLHCLTPGQEIDRTTQVSVAASAIRFRAPNEFEVPIESARE